MKPSWKLTLVASAITAILAGTGTYAALAGTSSPPECGEVLIQNPSGPGLWVKGCGTGSNGESPFVTTLPGHGPLVSDGSYIHSDGCGAVRANPCVWLWLKSPGS